MSSQGRSYGAPFSPQDLYSQWPGRRPVHPSPLRSTWTVEDSSDILQYIPTGQTAPGRYAGFPNPAIWQSPTSRGLPPIPPIGPYLFLQRQENPSHGPQSPSILSPLVLAFPRTSSDESTWDQSSSTPRLAPRTAQPSLPPPTVAPTGSTATQAHSTSANVGS
ncbi:uncharacterized protein STEHIDRAFT_122799, partial [Stereum hirsutum FP-91666 SS1]|uniref:uncharacterized protein n=1 Tax=Stereum hirsutum (strain FP-91666) TaxID=721885 RepID=UPI000444A246